MEVDGKTVVISIHAPHAGRDRKSYPCRMGGSTYFTPRAPCGARPLVPGIYQLLKNHFNPRTPCGARRQIHQDHRLTMEFQSTRPMRGATKVMVPTFCQRVFQSTRPVRGATALLYTAAWSYAISIHAPRAGRDHSCLESQSAMPLFQSTRPVRGAPVYASASGRDRWYFNPRAPCGARPGGGKC